MFSLVITVVAVALVAALVLATLFYGGESFKDGRAKAEAAKLTNQGQQLLGAAELYYLNNGQWPASVEQLQVDGYLKDIPVAVRTGVQDAYAARTWRMPISRQPLFVIDEGSETVCRKVNEFAYGLDGVLPKLQPEYVQQCFGKSTSELLVVVGRGRLSELLQGGEDPLTPENISSDPIPSPADKDAWTVPPSISKDMPALGPVVFEYPDSTGFGSVATHTSKDVEVFVRNRSTGAVSLTAPTLEGEPDFALVSTNCTATLEASEACSVTLRYSPTTPGTKRVDLVVSSEYRGTLEGTAYNPLSLQEFALPTAKLGMAYGAVDFSNLLSASNEGSLQKSLVTWSLLDQLPQGLTFNTTTGVLSGTPSQLTDPEVTDFRVLATYKNNRAQQVYTIRVGDSILYATQLALGNDFSCALTVDGAVKCWGDWWGEPYTSPPRGAGVPAAYVTSSAYLVPITLPGLESGVVKISKGTYHACALTQASELYCWGYWGQQLYGEGAEPAPVRMFQNVTGIRDVGTGGNNTCILKENGSISCTYGCATTVSNSCFQNSLADIIDWSVGPYHMCMVSGAGVVHCQGRNDAYQYGRAMTASQTWVAVSGLPTGFEKVVTSQSGYGDMSCAQHSNGDIYCWGGKYSCGSYCTRYINPTKLTNVPPGVVDLMVDGFKACVVTSAGALYCNASAVYTDASLSVVDGFESGVAEFAKGAATCVRKTDNRVLCWGANNNGQLGDGTTINRWTPGAVKEGY